MLNDSDQYATFDRMYVPLHEEDPEITLTRSFRRRDASDPTHSFLAKDHFNNILNEIAGKVSIVIIAHAVKAMVRAWEDKNVDPNQVATEILECMHHPYYFVRSFLLPLGSLRYSCVFDADSV